MVRLAFLFLFRKLFLHQGRGYIILIDALIAAVTLFMLAYTGTQVFVCGVHPTAQWTNHDTAAEYCFTNVTYNFGVSIVTVVLDVTVFLLPMYPLLRITQTSMSPCLGRGMVTNKLADLRISVNKEKRNYILVVFCFGFL